MFIMLSIALIFARKNGSAESEDEIKRMWETCREYDSETEHYFHKRTGLTLLTVPGRAGRALALMFYDISHMIVRFN